MTADRDNTVSPPAELKAIAARVQARLAEILTAERRQWAALDPSLDEPLGDLADMVLGGGKRIRPAYCHWGWLMGGGGPDGDGALDAGCALEILHAFALAHDDVMDASPTRRGAPTVWRKFVQRHRDRRLARRGPALRRGGRGAGGRHGHGARQPHARAECPPRPGRCGTNCAPS